MRLLFADLKALVAADLAASLLSCITPSRSYNTATATRFIHSDCGYVDPIRTTAPDEFAELFSYFYVLSGGNAI